MVQPHSSSLLRTCAAPAHLATSSRRCARPVAVAVACPSWVTDRTCVTYRARLTWVAVVRLFSSVLVASRGSAHALLARLLFACPGLCAKRCQKARGNWVGSNLQCEALALAQGEELATAQQQQSALDEYEPEPFIDGGRRANRFAPR